MLDAVASIRGRIPDFEFLLVGSGPQKYLVNQFCAVHRWAKYLGVRKGQAKADALALAKVMINPGVVGLNILDSFVAGVPIVTTNCQGHGPEIAYLTHGENGLMTANSLEDYVAAASKLLRDKPTMDSLVIACKGSAQKYTVENMARNFADGVLRCLELPILRGRRD